MDILYYKLIAFLCLEACIGINGEQLTKINSTKGKDIDGPTLIKLGRQLHKPMLTIVGMAISNLHQCGGWTQWSTCDTIVLGSFGTRKRSRKCDIAKTLDSADYSETQLQTESDWSICEGYCPSQYNITTNGFCMKLYVAAKNNDDAETQCQNDGGHLVNIDSDLKYNNVKGVLTGFTANIFIDGRRKDPSSAWEYKYGSQRDTFDWHSGYPRNSANYLCLALSSTRQFFDYLCSTTYAFVCEIPAA